MSSDEAQTPQPSAAPNAQAAAADAAASKLFSPRSAAALALSNFSRSDSSSEQGSATKEREESKGDSPSNDSMPGATTSPPGENSQQATSLGTVDARAMMMMPIMGSDPHPFGPRRVSDVSVHHSTPPNAPSGGRGMPYQVHPAYPPFVAPPHPSMMPQTGHPWGGPTPPMGVVPPPYGTMVFYDYRGGARNGPPQGFYAADPSMYPMPVPPRAQGNDENVLPLPVSSMNLPKPGARKSENFHSKASKKSRTDENTKRKPTKSLGMLTEAFIQYYNSAQSGPHEKIDVQIDVLSEMFEVERRRIYDVINILESLRIVVKRAKNAYQWMGTDHLPRLFAIMQQDAICMWPRDAAASGLISQPPSEEELQQFKDAPDQEIDLKSLCKLSTNFLRCFLIGHLDVSLPEAAEKISGEETTMEDLCLLGCKNKRELMPTDPRLFQQAAMRGLKKKLRRYYDCCNVFVACGILQKLDEKNLPLDVRRPRYRWIYPLTPAQIRHGYQKIPDVMKTTRIPFLKDAEEAHAAKLHYESLTGNRSFSKVVDASDDQLAKLWASLGRPAAAMTTNVPSSRNLELRRVSLPLTVSRESSDL